MYIINWQTTLRQEGVTLPVRQSQAKKSSIVHSEASDSSPQDLPPVNIENSNDFVAVLKDLQTLSVSLLGMDKEEPM